MTFSISGDRGRPATDWQRFDKDISPMLNKSDKPVLIIGKGASRPDSHPASRTVCLHDVRGGVLKANGRNMAALNKRLPSGWVARSTSDQNIVALVSVSEQPSANQVA